MCKWFRTCTLCEHKFHNEIKCLVFIYVCVSVNIEHEMCKCKNKYTYIYIKCDFYLGEGDFIMFFYNGLTKWPIAKIYIHIKRFMLWHESQLNKLIDMNHNKYLSSCKSLGQKWWRTRLGINVLFKQLGGTKCVFKICFGTVDHNLILVKKC